MAGVAENLNVCVITTLEKPATKVVRRRKQFLVEQLSNNYILHSAVRTLF